MAHHATARIDRGYAVLAEADPPDLWRSVGASARWRAEREPSGAAPLQAALRWVVEHRGAPTRSVIVELPGLLPIGRAADAWALVSAARDGQPVEATPLRPAASWTVRPGMRPVLLEWEEPASGPMTFDFVLTDLAPAVLPELAIYTDPFPHTPPLAALPALAGQVPAGPFEAVFDLAPGLAALTGGEGQAAPLASGEGSRWTVRGTGPLAWSLTERSVEVLPGLRSALGPGDGWALLRAQRALADWTGWTQAPPVAIGLQPAEARPPVARALPGVAVVRPVTVLRDSHLDAQVLWRPEQETFLALEGLAAASLSHLARDPEEAAVAAGLARAFALSGVASKSAEAARVWRESLQACLRVQDPSASFGPLHAATTGYLEVSRSCYLPLLLGVGLEERLGGEAAARVRRAVIAGGDLREGAWRAQLLAEDPTIGPWVDRWWLNGRPLLEASLQVSTHQEGEVWVVEGVLRVEGDPVQIGVPIQVRGARTLDLRLVPQGPETPFRWELPFRPRAIGVDPEHRLPLAAEHPEQPLPVGISPG